MESPQWQPPLSEILPLPLEVHTALPSHICLSSSLGVQYNDVGVSVLGLALLLVWVDFLLPLSYSDSTSLICLGCVCYCILCFYGIVSCCRAKRQKWQTLNKGQRNPSPALGRLMSAATAQHCCERAIRHFQASRSSAWSCVSPGISKMMCQFFPACFFLLQDSI